MISRNHSSNLATPAITIRHHPKSRQDSAGRPALFRRAGRLWGAGFPAEQRQGSPQVQGEMELETTTSKNFAPANAIT
ncbi:MAG: hypothetical protein LBQ73_09445 [Tannerellaceae bacterium]|nr:hypothetical protein [Tannerellaceae bacterium]